MCVRRGADRGVDMTAVRKRELSSCGALCAEASEQVLGRAAVSGAGYSLNCGT